MIMVIMMCLCQLNMLTSFMPSHAHKCSYLYCSFFPYALQYVYYIITGPSVFAGIAAILIVIPLNSHFLNKISECREVSSKLTDKRVKLTNELLQGIAAIKSYSWETPFAIQLQKLREDELQCLQ